jgi:hypothetical protein
VRAEINLIRHQNYDILWKTRTVFDSLNVHMLTITAVDENNMLLFLNSIYERKTHGLGKKFHKLCVSKSYT